MTTLRYDQPVTYVDHAGTITLGGTAQTVMAANSLRAAFFVYNESDTNMRVCFGPATASASVGFQLAPGYYWEPPAVSADTVTIFCATTGKAFSAGEFTWH